MQFFMSGIRLTRYSEVRIGESGPPAVEQVLYRPYPAALGYVVFAGLTGLGLVRRRWLPLAWLGTLALAAWSTIWLFSSGAAFVVAEGVLAALVLLISFTWRQPAA
jgi:hypothetical protein